MTDAWALVIASAVPVVGGGVGYVIKLVLDMKKEQSAEIRSFREENRVDHGIVMNAISEIRQDVKDIRQSQNAHLEWHVTQQVGAKPRPRAKRK